MRKHIPSYALYLSNIMDNQTSQELNIAYQIIDANLNRIREGMRCVEEAIRYDEHQKINYSSFRALRHNFSEIEQRLRYSFPQLLENRNMKSDRGTKELAVTTRKNINELVKANANRVSEGLRVVEEYLKLLPGASKYTEKIKSIRYDWYSLDQHLASFFSV
jgi:hypothetical protein